MAKNKGTHGRGESDIAVGDQFLLGAESVMHKLKPHVSKVVTLFVLALAALVVFSVYDHFKKKKASTFTDTYFETMRQANGVVLAEGEEPTELDVVSTPLEEVYFKSQQEKSGAVTSQLESLVAKGNSGEYVRMIYGKELLTAGKFEEAKTQFETFLDKGVGPKEAITARENIAYALEAKALAAETPEQKQAGLSAALEAFKSMQKDPEGSQYDVSLYHQGRLLKDLGKNDESKKMIQKLVTDFPDSIFKGMAENMLIDFI